MKVNEKMDSTLLKNKRLHFVLMVLWSFACFIIIRYEPVKTADTLLKIDMTSCYERENHAQVKSCVNGAMEHYRELLEITNSQVIDMFALFLFPIIVLLVLAAVIKWIGNYKY
jgi:hypothetical protein